MLPSQEMCRALFVFAKLNPGLTYVQGMNELYAPLYYLCAHESGSKDGEHAGEASSSALTARQLRTYSVVMSRSISIGWCGRSCPWV